MSWQALLLFRGLALHWNFPENAGKKTCKHNMPVYIYKCGGLMVLQKECRGALLN